MIYVNLKFCMPIFIIYHLFICSYTKGDQSTSHQIQKGPVKDSVLDRNLATENINAEDIVQWNKAYHHDVSKKSSVVAVLGYVTPWNNHGYDVAKIFSQKFTHISPVWLQLKINHEEGGYKITGQHDIDNNWIQDVKKGSKTSTVKVIPRIIFEEWSPKNFQDLVKQKSKQKQLANYLIKFLKNNNQDGFVVEVWSQIPTMEILRSFTSVISTLGNAIRNEGFVFVLVVPPPLYKNDARVIFGRKEFDELEDSVDAFSLMTYDYSNFQNPGPNSPAHWVRKCVETLVPDATSPSRKKILLGMNFYGLDHSVTGGKHIVGHEYIDILSKYKPKFFFNEESVEHDFKYKSSQGTRHVYYPSLKSVHHRIKLAESLNTGVSLWEIGQGLDFFYDLF